MPKLAANLSTLFPHLDFLDRFAAAARAGFRSVEFQFPYAHPAPAVAECARAAGVEVVLHNAPPGSRPGDRGVACLPGREAEFRDTAERALEYARAVGCRRIHCLAGVLPEGADRARHHDVYVANLRHAAERFAAQGVVLLVEPINTRSIPGYFLTGTRQAEQVLEEIAAPNAFIQFDLFHMQIMQGDLAHTVERLLPRIGHMQLADVPGRNEPGTGEINFDFLLRHIDALGYAGWIGCEYNPIGDTAEGLAWAKRWL